MSLTPFQKPGYFVRLESVWPQNERQDGRPGSTNREPEKTARIAGGCRRVENRKQDKTVRCPILFRNCRHPKEILPTLPAPAWETVSNSLNADNGSCGA